MIKISTHLIQPICSLFLHFLLFVYIWCLYFQFWYDLGHILVSGLFVFSLRTLEFQVSNYIDSSNEFTLFILHNFIQHSTYNFWPSNGLLQSRVLSSTILFFFRLSIIQNSISQRALALILSIMQNSVLSERSHWFSVEIYVWRQTFSDTNTGSLRKFADTFLRYILAQLTYGNIQKMKGHRFEWSNFCRIYAR